MRFMASLSLASLLLVGGCPTAQQSVVTATIAASSTKGPAPWSVTFSGLTSSSVNGGPLEYLWNFADGGSSDQAVATHVFQKPGYYLVKLTVKDPNGEQGVDAVDIRAQGTGAVAVIGPDVRSGAVPLTVQFDGTGSQAPDDVVRDYFWDFGNGGSSRASQPRITYYYAGTYTVKLDIETAGGVAAHTETTITVGERIASLLFNGSSFATLPLGGTQSLAACTFEAWVKSQADGGTVVSIGSGALTVDLRPASNSIRLTVAGVSTDAAATNLTGTWRHLAAVYDSANQVCVLYLDGASIGRATIQDPLSADQLTLGIGLRGNIGEVRFWSIARPNSALLSTKDTRLTGSETSLYAYWPCDAGSGQLLADQTGHGRTGTLGSSSSTEGTADPAWSSDAPPVQ